MSDIVKELRKGIQYNGYHGVGEAEETMLAAADRIERLQKVVIEVARLARESLGEKDD